MKKNLILLAIVAIITQGCAIAEDMQSRCTDETQMLCNNLFGMKDSEQDSELAEQANSINELILIQEDMAYAFINLSVYLSQLEHVQLSQLNQLTTLEANYTALEVRVAELETHLDVVEVINPCGDHPTVLDEVLLKMSNGTIIASVSDNSNGKNTRFSIIPSGSYITTDGSNCRFNVTTSGAVTW